MRAVLFIITVLLSVQLVLAADATIKLKQGVEANLPTLQAGEPAFTTDSKKLFIGSSAGNVEFMKTIPTTCVGRVAYDGLDGSVIYTVSGVPDNAVGKKIDVALDTLTGNFYRKDTATTWTLKGNIKGVDGAPGVAGSNGTNGTNGADGAAATVAVGSVTDLAYGSTPYVTNAGTSYAALLHFGLVQGAPGSAGSPDTQAQILSKIATPTVGASLGQQAGVGDSATLPKIWVRDSSGNLKCHINAGGNLVCKDIYGDGWVTITSNSIEIQRSGVKRFSYNNDTEQSLTMYRGDGTTIAFKVWSSGRMKATGGLTL